MKQLIKAIVPRTVLSSAIETRDWLRLVALPRQSFHSSKLCSAQALPLADIFGNQDIGRIARGEKDHRAIKNLYGDEDMEGASIRATVAPCIT